MHTEMFQCRKTVYIRMTNWNFSYTEQVPDRMRPLVIVHVDALIISTALNVLAPVQHVQIMA